MEISSKRYFSRSSQLVTVCVATVFFVGCATQAPPQVVKESPQANAAQNLWAEGKGTLTGSAEATVIECRGKTDTTCRAIQVLDKGFPERPVIGEDVLAGRDEIVNNPTVTPDDNGTCKNFLGAYDVIVGLTDGGPGTATRSVTMTIIRGFYSGDYAYQMATATLFFIITIIIAVLQLSVTRGRSAL